MIIYLDLDGVLVDLYSAVKKANNIRNYAPAPGVYSFDAIFKRKIDLDRHTVSWWAGLGRTEESSDIVELAHHHGEPCIATSAAGRPNAAAGKLLWCKKHYPSLPIVLVDQKWRLATKHSILIDDSDDQVDDFNAVGGHGVHMPRHWNRCHGITDPLAYIEKSINGAKDYYHG